jgi:hypothetical protein
MASFGAEDRYHPAAEASNGPTPFDITLGEMADRMASQFQQEEKDQVHAEIPAICDLRNHLHSKVVSAKNLDEFDEQLDELEVELRSRLDWTRQVFEARSRFLTAKETLEVAKSKLNALAFFEQGVKLAGTLSDPELKETVMANARIVLNSHSNYAPTVAALVDIQKTAVNIVGFALTAPLDFYRERLWRLRMLRRALSVLWGLGVMTLLVGALIGRIPSQWLSLLVLPIGLYVLQMWKLDPWFKRLMFERQRKDLLLAIDQFCVTYFSAECSLIILKPLITDAAGAGIA